MENVIVDRLQQSTHIVVESDSSTQGAQVSTAHEDVHDLLIFFFRRSFLVFVDEDADREDDVKFAGNNRTSYDETVHQTTEGRSKPELRYRAAKRIVFRLQTAGPPTVCDVVR